MLTKNVIISILNPHYKIIIKLIVSEKSKRKNYDKFRHNYF